MRVAWILAGAAVVVASACSGSSPRATPATSTTSTTSTAGTVAAETSSVPVPLTTTTTPVSTTTTEALVPQTSPDIAAQSLFDAWRRGDRAAALHVATPAAVAVLFGQPVASYSDRGCQDPISDRALCAFGIGNSLAQIGTVTLAGGWVVETVTIE